MTDQRPDTDAPQPPAGLDRPDERRGRLKVFFGACAGVGKTYAMLEAARKRRAEGIELVAGFVETHGRKETEALLEGLEVLPPLWVEYRGIRLREFDLDAALHRQPALVLVDELAHANAEGLRHAKRWQDVVELLDAGIDVYTTVNVQHIESLNDVVAQITGIIVRETVPDSILERADEIELVDLPPDELLQRLKEGKVYVPEQAERATAKFFRKENLAALRELALRQTADRVNAQLQAERTGLGEGRPLPTAERLLVCVGPSPLSARVIRTARRMTDSLRAEWIAASVETPGQSRSAADRVRRNIKLAERLGAETVVLTGDHVAEEIISFAVRRNVTKIVVGKSDRSPWLERLTGSVVNDLIRLSGEIDVHVVKGEPDEGRQRPFTVPMRPVRRRDYGWSVAVMAVCTLIAWPMFPFLSAVNLTMIYLAGVVFVAARFGGGPSVLASILGPLLFNFFFTKPYHSFAIADTQYLVTFVALLATALVISGLTNRVRRQSEGARVRYLRTVALYFMSRQLAAAAGEEALAKVAARHVADVFQGDAVVLTPGPSGLTVAAKHGDFSADQPKEHAAAEWVHAHRQWAGWGTETLSASQAIYMPLVASGQSLGVLGLRPKNPDLPLEPDQRHMLETFATQLAIALERTRFAEQAEHARLNAEAERMRSVLLSSVSHDLRTPLAAITGAASTLLDQPAGLSQETSRELLASIYDEGSRLNHLVGNLLEMTRLESGEVQLNREWYPLEELVGSALNRLEHLLSGHKVLGDIPADLPLVNADGVLLEQVLINLLENAARYTPSGTTIRIAARAAPGQLVVDVSDEGPGLKPGTESDLFRKFQRQRPPTDRSGSGLGLSICQAIIKLHGGAMGAENRPAKGARFWFALPLPEQSVRMTPAKPLPPLPHDLPSPGNQT